MGSDICMKIKTHQKFGSWRKRNLFGFLIIFVFKNQNSWVVVKHDDITNHSLSHDLLECFVFK